MGSGGIKQAYRTGRGRIVVRARAEIEQYKPSHARIIVTEIPYQVNKARLVERIAELVHDKRSRASATCATKPTAKECG